MYTYILDVCVQQPTAARPHPWPPSRPFVLYMYIGYIHVHITHSHTYKHTLTSTHAHTWKHTCVQTHTHKLANTCTQAYTHTRTTTHTTPIYCGPCVYVHVCGCICVWVCESVLVCACVRVYAGDYVCVYPHVGSSIGARVFLGSCVYLRESVLSPSIRILSWKVLQAHAYIHPHTHPHTSTHTLTNKPDPPQSG